jgi:hypothetical protein
LVLILKETNAQVRDASINLIIAFKLTLQGTDSAAIIEEFINQLPKYRVAEITKKVNETLGINSE